MPVRDYCLALLNYIPDLPVGPSWFDPKFSTADGDEYGTIINCLLDDINPIVATFYV